MRTKLEGGRVFRLFISITPALGIMDPRMLTEASAINTALPGTLTPHGRHTIK